MRQLWLIRLQRGTYTSHGAIKRGNRKSEILMREAEYAATMASLMDANYTYPKEVNRRPCAMCDAARRLAIRCGVGGSAALSVPRCTTRKRDRNG